MKNFIIFLAVLFFWTSKDTLAQKSNESRNKKQVEYDQKQYGAFINAGDAAFLAKNYPEAKDAYAKASAVRSEEKYPKEKFDEINEFLKMEAERANYEKQMALLKKENEAQATKMQELQARADSSNKQLLAAKMEAEKVKKEVEKKADNTKADTLAKKTEVKKSAATPAKTKPAGPKMVKVIEMEINGNITKNPNIKMPQPKKGVVDSMNYLGKVLVRYSELEAYRKTAAYKYHLQKGDTLYAPNR